MKLNFDKDDNGEGMKGIATLYNLPHSGPIILLAPDTKGLESAVKELDFRPDSLDFEKVVSVVYKQLDEKVIKEPTYAIYIKQIKKPNKKIYGFFPSILSVYSYTPSKKESSAFIVQNDNGKETPVYRWKQTTNCWVRINFDVFIENDPDDEIPF